MRAHFSMFNTKFCCKALALTSIFSLVSCGDGKGDERPGPPAVDSTAPVITLNGSSTVNVTLGNTYNELGASAKDDVDGTVDVAISGEVDTAALGTYTITYTASDKAGNQATARREVTVEKSRPFITTWNTEGNGVSGVDQIMLDTIGGGYNYTVDWGDDQKDENVTGDITHTYEKAGVYKVTITGDFPRLFMAPIEVTTNPDDSQETYQYASDNQKLVSVDQWGSIRWQSMNSAFRSTKVSINTSDQPYLNEVEDMSDMFSCDSVQLGCAISVDVTNWDVANVTNMSGMFTRSSFNGHIANWDVRNVSQMQNMFAHTLYFNQDISEWNVAGVTNMASMFESAAVFNGVIGGWDVSKVTDMNSMFHNAKNFNQALAEWDVANVINMARMFSGASSFDKPIGDWDVKKVLSMANMFSHSETFNQDISNWQLDSLTSMEAMFEGATKFNQNIGSWNVSKVTNMSHLFRSAIEFSQNLNDWDVSNVTNMSNMFRQASKFNSDMSEWKVSKVTDTTYMFSDATDFNQDISGWDVSNVTGMSYMFFCSSANCNFNQNLGSWNVANVQHMWQMFGGITLSTANYSDILDGWSDLQLQQDVTFHAGNSKYNAFGRFARIDIINQFNWTIEDGGFSN